LLAGKGHEKVQVTREGAAPFDDLEVARDALRAAGFECETGFSGSEGMKLTLSRIAEFVSAAGMTSSRRKTWRGGTRLTRGQWVRASFSLR
jgi:hypothetical protein